MGNRWRLPKVRFRVTLMHWLISTGLTNAALATLLAVAAWIVARMCRLPALTHLLWVIVLLKLLTPPHVQAPIAWKLDLSWTGSRLLDTQPPVGEATQQAVASSPVRFSISQDVTDVEYSSHPGRIAAVPARPMSGVTPVAEP